MIKKTLLSLSLLVAIFTVKAQSVENGTNMVGLGLRLGIYNTIQTLKAPPPGTNPRYNGQAGVLIFPFSYDQSLNDHFTFGGQFRYNSFLLGKDTSATQLNVAYSLELGIDAAYHFIRSEHTDLYIQAMVGASFIKIANTNINYQGVYTAEGISYGIELGARFYLGDHFGIMLNFAYSGYDYPSGTYAVLGGNSETFNYFFTGTTYGFGICYKFHYKA